jgi:N-methylhydantoinase B
MHLFWAVTKGHQMDTGAFVPSSVTAAARNVWQEGIIIPPVKLFEKGEICAGVLDIYLSNVRYRDLLHGDLLAQLGSIEKGRSRLVELCREYGPDEIVRYVDALFEYSSERMSTCLKRIPAGTYTGDGWVDTDGFAAVDIPIHVEVIVDGDRVKIDFSGSGPEAEGGVNASLAAAHATAAIPFMYYIDADIPHNHGVITHIEVYAPEGTICNARFPASTSCATDVPSDMMHDAINKAMASAIPDLVPAGGTRQSNIPQFSGRDPETSEEWGVMLFNGTGGSGASHSTDGWPLFESLGGFGAVKTQSIEEIELLYPLHVETMEIATDSMGFGRWIGGPGTQLRVRPAQDDVHCITFGDGCRNPPHGVLGGTPGIGGGAYTEDLATGKRRFAPAAAHVRLGAGEVWVGVSTGGGGYGRPEERDAEQVRREIRDGIISRRAAEVIFGVIVGDGPDPVLDLTATGVRRAELAARDSPLVKPTGPAAATWVEENLRDGDEYIMNAN